jgi:hypothetical protein
MTGTILKARDIPGYPLRDLSNALVAHRANRKPEFLSLHQSLLPRKEGCPHCGESRYYMNDGERHWAVCPMHNTSWPIGKGWYNTWMKENPTIWIRNRFRLRRTTLVNPVVVYK